MEGEDGPEVGQQIPSVGGWLQNRAGMAVLLSSSAMLFSPADIHC